jgi:hypothetical protein
MRSNLAFAAAIGLALCAGAARADWKKDYDRGLKAIEAGQWAEAEAAFRAALADDPEPNARKRFQGVVMKPYVPHHYAAVAAWRGGDCAAALEYWSHGPTSTVVASQPELQAMKSKGTGECNQKLAAAAKPAPPVAAVAKPQPPAATPVRPPVSTPPPAAAKPTPPPAATVATAPRPEAKPAAPATVAAPAALVSAVEAYLAGRYAAVAQLDPAALADGRAKAQGFLLRAASRYTLAQLAEGDAAQLEQARRDVRAARSANAALNPDETAFSPRFRAFWRETR